jgi:hypothetical protein
MKRSAVYWTLIVTLALSVAGSTALATPTPPYLIVNHDMQQCAESILGDDCSWCDPPQGWEVVGPSSNNQCPEGYAWVERLDMACRRYKNEFCCTSGQHHGDCEDMVVHHADGLCAFVDDIEGCILPAGWTARPPDVSPLSWSCPYDYGWTDAMACLAPDLENEPPAQQIGVPPRAAFLIAICIGAFLLAVVAAGLVLAWLLARRRRP